MTKAVTAVASNPQVREVMVERQRTWIANNAGGVLEGRDIGTVVCPDATLKVYLVADPGVRAQRRAAEHGEAVAHDMRRRDQADSTRDVSPLMLRLALPSIESDTTVAAGVGATVELPQPAAISVTKAPMKTKPSRILLAEPSQERSQRDY